MKRLLAFCLIATMPFTMGMGANYPIPIGKIYHYSVYENSFYWCDVYAVYEDDYCNKNKGFVRIDSGGTPSNYVSENLIVYYEGRPPYDRRVVEERRLVEDWCQKFYDIYPQPERYVAILNEGLYLPYERVVKRGYLDDHFMHILMENGKWYVSKKRIK